MIHIAPHRSNLSAGGELTSSHQDEGCAYADTDRISNWVPELYNGVSPLSGLLRADQATSLGVGRGLVSRPAA